jgi:hypothetical protein
LAPLKHDEDFNDEQWRGGGKKHAAKSMRGLRGVAEIAANIKKESMNLGI